jgi:hypothetical protein
MPGEFYVEGKNEKVDITEIRNIISEVQIGIASLVSMADFWSESVEEVQVNAAGVTVTLPGEVIDRIPAGASILRAIAMFKFRMVENTNAAANKLNGATVPGISQVMQVRDDTPGVWIDAINFVDDQFSLEGQTREGGDVCIGSKDISSIVDGNGGYEFRWFLGKADLDFINFNDVQMGIRVWFTGQPV